MKNFVGPGDTLEFTAAADSAGGTGLLLGTIFGIVVATVATGGTGLLKTTGVFDVVKAGSQAWTVGAAVYWDNTAKNFTTTSSGNTKVGVAVLAVGSGAGETTGRVRLNGAF